MKLPLNASVKASKKKIHTFSKSIKVPVKICKFDKSLACLSVLFAAAFICFPIIFTCSYVYSQNMQNKRVQENPTVFYPHLLFIRDLCSKAHTWCAQICLWYANLHKFFQFHCRLFPSKFNFTGEYTQQV